jgi:hypothetical protein
VKNFTSDKADRTNNDIKAYLAKHHTSESEDEGGWQAAPRVPVGYNDGYINQPAHVSSVPEARVTSPLQEGWSTATKRGKKNKGRY